MAKSLLFIPDISGFTNFVQTTEVEHSQHVIAELLEILLAANTENLILAEIEGDALFFYKEEEVLSQEKLLAQVETMYTAFYSHLKMVEKNRICPCRACSSAVNLELKIVAHTGTLQFLEVQGNRKPFGEAVIQVHRLLKNSVKSDNYLLISQDLASDINLPVNYERSLYQFKSGINTYDEKEVRYLYSEIDVEKLKLQPFQEGHFVTFNRKPNLVFERTFPLNATELLEIITNYKFRHLWVNGVDEFLYNENEVTRLGSEHVCVIGNQHLDLKVITKESKDGALVYGETTTSPAPLDVLYQFFNILPVSDQESKLMVEFFWEAKSILKKTVIFLFAKKAFSKNMNESLDRLAELLSKQEGLNK